MNDGRERLIEFLDTTTIITKEKEIDKKDAFPHRDLEQYFSRKSINFETNREKVRNSLWSGASIFESLFSQHHNEIPDFSEPIPETDSEDSISVTESEASEIFHSVKHLPLIEVRRTFKKLVSEKKTAKRKSFPHVSGSMVSPGATGRPSRILSKMFSPKLARFQAQVSSRLSNISTHHTHSPKTRRYRSASFNGQQSPQPNGADISEVSGLKTARNSRLRKAKKSMMSLSPRVSFLRPQTEGKRRPSFLLNASFLNTSGNNKDISFRKAFRNFVYTKYFKDEKILFSKFTSHKPCLKCAKLVTDPLTWTMCVGNDENDTFTLPVSFHAQCSIAGLNWVSREGELKLDQGRLKIYSAKDLIHAFHVFDIVEVSRGEAELNQLKITVYLPLAQFASEEEDSKRLLRETLLLEFSSPESLEDVAEKIFLYMSQTVSVIDDHLPLVLKLTMPQNKRHAECLMRKKAALITMYSLKNDFRFQGGYESLLEYLETMGDEAACALIQEKLQTLSTESGDGVDEFEQAKVNLLAL
eukprot:augustus_masked-scaffold_73-processed-gene-0.43-mRNA-1 protein AED:1.00 eAED:1.00 QI:0/-1/0/0/-1/1/1/0/527